MINLSAVPNCIADSALADEAAVNWGASAPLYLCEFI